MEIRSALVDEANKNANVPRNAMKVAVESLEGHPQHAREAEEVARVLSLFGKRLSEL